MQGNSRAEREMCGLLLCALFLASLAHLHEYVLFPLLFMFRPTLWLGFGGFLWSLHFLDVNLVPDLIVHSAILMCELAPF